jgi:hypothetical protein
MGTLTAALGLSAIPRGATFAWLSADTQAVRITLDGTTPTATVGNLIPAGTEGVWLNLVDLAAVQVIEAAASAALNVSYFRPKATG